MQFEYKEIMVRKFSKLMGKYRSKDWLTLLINGNGTMVVKIKKWAFSPLIDWNNVVLFSFEANSINQNFDVIGHGGSEYIKAKCQNKIMMIYVNQGRCIILWLGYDRSMGKSVRQNGSDITRKTVKFYTLKHVWRH